MAMKDVTARIARALLRQVIGVAIVTLACSLWARTAPAQSIAERLGPQFVLSWTQQEREVAEYALGRRLDEVRDQTRWKWHWRAHVVQWRTGVGWDLLARRDRILRRMAHGFGLYDADWHPVELQLRGPDGAPFHVYQFSLPETILVGFSVSRAMDCRWQDQDMEPDAARSFCARMSVTASAMMEKFSKLKHDYPGGNTK